MERHILFPMQNIMGYSWGIKEYQLENIITGSDHPVKKDVQR